MFLNGIISAFLSLFSPKCYRTGIFRKLCAKSHKLKISDLAHKNGRFKFITQNDTHKHPYPVLQVRVV